MHVLQLNVHAQNHVYLIDTQVLGKTAFTVTGRGGETLGSILESATVLKVFFDVRSTSYLLYLEFGIALQGVQDVQLMQLASDSRLRTKHFALNLNKCIHRDALTTLAKKQHCRAISDAAQRLVLSRGGSTREAFGTRPLDKDIRAFCVQDVQYLPHLHKLYWDQNIKLGREQLVTAETTKRLQISQSAEYPHSVHFRSTLNPWLDQQTWRSNANGPQVNGLKSKSVTGNRNLHICSNPGVNRFRSKNPVKEFLYPQFRVFRRLLRP